MCYAIVSGNGKNKFYFTRIERGMCARWDDDGYGQIVCKVKKIPRKETGKEKGIQVVGHYVPELSMARKFRTREKAESMIAEYSVLRFCHVEEVPV